MMAIVVTFIFGTLIGSFLNVVIWRLPRGETLGGRSHCPHCRHVLQWTELIPVFSYLAQRGKCTNCHQRISPRYMYIELVTGALFAVAAVNILPATISSPVVVELLRAFFVISILIAVFVIDLEHYLILDNIVFPAIGVALLFNLVLDILAQQSFLSFHSYTGGGLIAAVVAGTFFYAIWRVSRGRWMGFGDVKFSIFLGLALGWPGILVGLFLAFMSGALLGVVLLATGRKNMHSRLPFGTFLALGALLALFYSPQLAHWYGSLIGV